jgi:hypothetical protein
MRRFRQYLCSAGLLSYNLALNPTETQMCEMIREKKKREATLRERGEREESAVPKQ